ncbi:MAG: hypothetical protein JO063_06110, partial [Pseudonocardiales bacterium]|nr:hypothetical protein [Pseudonocardiales bacterium]
NEELISLILFCKANSDTVIAPLPGSTGHTDYPPITAGDYLRERIAQTTVYPEARQQSLRES